MWRMARLTLDRTAALVSHDQILRRGWRQGKIHFPCSADLEQDWQPYWVDLYSTICSDEQDWQPYRVDPYSAICDDHKYIPVHA